MSTIVISSRIKKLQGAKPLAVDHNGHSFNANLVCVFEGCQQEWHMTEKPEPCLGDKQRRKREIEK